MRSSLQKCPINCDNLLNTVSEIWVFFAALAPVKQVEKNLICSGNTKINYHASYRVHALLHIRLKKRRTLILTNSNWKRFALVGRTNTAGNSLVFGST